MIKPSSEPHQEPLHQPVLLAEVLAVLSPQKSESYLDLTAGYGGHAAAVLKHTQAPLEAVLVDRDQQSIDHLSQQFGPTGPRLMHQDFWSASQELLDQGHQFDLILADLGVSSVHLNNAERGFTWRSGQPLDMRMDPRQSLTAERLVNTYSEADLKDILRRYGEEPKASVIAKAIVAARPLKTTDQLAALAARVWPGHSRVHPATRTFQAIRIAVNDELGLIERTLPLLPGLLKPGGRLAIISFHSLEDRLVKQFLAGEAGERYDARLQLLTKNPISASASEIAINPRARSAKLRAAVKIKNKEGALHANSGKKQLPSLQDPS